MSTAALADTPHSDAARRVAGWRPIVLGVACVYFVLLFVVWPYQHWSFAERGSVMEGWLRVLWDDKFLDWIFCYAVPPISAWLVYRERARLRQLPLHGSWWGAPLLLFAIFCYWAGYMVDTGYLGYAALQLSIAGLILLLGGMAWMRVLFLPWVFLAFAWPFFPLDNLLASRLKIPTAQVASQILSLTGVDLVREGSTLVSAANPAAGIAEGQKFRLDVSNDCSGMRSLYALITFAVLHAIVVVRGVGPRLLHIASAIPLAVAGNVVRLLMLAYGSLLFGQEFAVGQVMNKKLQTSTFHLAAGFVVFGVALAGMFALAAYFESRRQKRRRKPSSMSPAKDAASHESPPAEAVAALSTSSPLAKSVFALAMAVTAISLCWASPTSATLADPGLSLALPSLVAGYPSEELSSTAKERGSFEPGVELNRRLYFTPSGRTINATVVLSGLVKKTLHTPDKCLPDSGWHIARRDVVPVALADGRKIDASLMHIFYDRHLPDGRIVRLRALHLYWYHGSHGVSTPDYDMHNVITYRDAIFRQLNHRWCQVSFYTMLPPSLDGIDGLQQETEAEEELVRFAGKFSDVIVRK
jgi:exosortase